MRWEPTDAVAHLRLAEIHARLFEKLQMAGENPMPLRHIADAAVQQRFPTRAALVAWLTAAVGPHWEHLDRALHHARQAAALCPLRGRAYLALAELSFLGGDQGTLGQACIEQALRVRPQDGVILLAASQQAALAGDQRRAMEYAKLAFQSGPRQRQQVIAGFVAGTPTEGLPALIDSILADFRPDLEALRFLYAACAARCPRAVVAPDALLGREGGGRGGQAPRQQPLRRRLARSAARFTAGSATTPTPCAVPAMRFNAIRATTRSAGSLGSACSSRDRLPRPSRT